MGRGDIEAARIVGRFVVLRCAGKEGMRAVRDTVWKGARRMGFPPKGASAPGDGRHGARRRGLRAFALRLPCGFRFARLRRQRGNAGGAGYGVGEACAGWVSRRKGRARRAMGGMERGGGACARSPCVCRADFVLPVCAGKEGMRAVRDTVWEMRAPDGFPAERGERAGRWTAWSAAAGPARVRPALAVRISFCPFAPAKRECGRCRIRCGRCSRRMGFPSKGALARRAMGGMERGGGACARYCTPR